MNTLRTLHTLTTLLNGRALATGGGSSDSGPRLRSAELYDPDSRSWTLTPEMNEGRLNHTATLLYGGRVLIAGGTGDAGQLASAELYTSPPVPRRLRSKRR